MEDLVSPAQAAKMLGVSITTLRNWEKANKIECVKTLGGHRRFKLEDITRILKGELAK